MTAPAPPRYRIRPRAHMVVGIVLLIVAAGIAVVNDVPIGGEAGLLPGGHSEGYLMLVLAVAASATWWFGMFDRPSDGRTRG